MNIKPLGNKIAITRVAAEKQTDSGIVLQRSDEPDVAIVEVIGPDVEDVQVGDKLLINWNKAVKAQDELYIVTEDEVIWVYEE
jgi:co-chaperonin GroES (HSP10)